MIDEYRIGNWFIDYETELERTIYWQVEAIEKRSGNLGLTFRNGSSWNADPDPISLSPEILEKAGFVKSKTMDWWWKEYNEDGECIEIERINDVFYLEGKKTPKIESVHQFQNLFYSISQQELNIQL